MTHQYLQRFQSQLNLLDEQFLRRKTRVCETPSAPQMTIEGRDMLTFCSNDYLGLANHPEVAQALREGVQHYGNGSGASHLISGHSKAHQLIEEALASTQANHIPEVQAITLSTGFMANMAMITGLINGLSESDGITIFSEELNHASLIDSIRLAGQQKKFDLRIYGHQNLNELEALLSSDKNRQKIIVTDAVFSMDGDIANLTELIKLAEQYDALLVVDDAHGFGVLGQDGHGSLEHFNLKPNSRIIYMGTLGKAAGISGAFIAAHQDIVQWILQTGRAYIYTTASPPMIAHGLLKSLDLIQTGDVRRQLFNNIAYFKKNLSLKHWKLLDSGTAIQPIVIGDNAKALSVAQQLFDQGIWAPAIRPPTVPKGTARLRITLSAAHQPEQINRLVVALHSAEKALGN